MKQPNKKLYTVIIFIVILAVIFIWRPYRQVETQIIVEEVAEVELSAVPFVAVNEPEVGTVNSVENFGTELATVLAGDTKIQLQFNPGTIFYDALAQAQNQGQIEFKGKNYSSLGFFVTDIGTLHSGDEGYLLYYVNGKKATVGVSTYTLKNGDIIEWKLE